MAWLEADHRVATAISSVLHLSRVPLSHQLRRRLERSRGGLECGALDTPAELTELQHAKSPPRRAAVRNVRRRAAVPLERLVVRLVRLESLREQRRTSHRIGLTIDAVRVVADDFAMLRAQQHAVPHAA